MKLPFSSSENKPEVVPTESEIIVEGISIETLPNDTKKENEEVPTVYGIQKIFQFY